MQRTIKGLRSDLNLSQYEMAKKLGIGIQTYRNKEAYRSELTATELMALCDIAGVNPNEVKIKA